VAKKMRAAGWKGLFGIDCIYDAERNVVNIIEINARQPASTSYESELQNNLRGHGLLGMTIYEAHILALGGNLKNHDAKSGEKIIEINDGAQILERVTLFSEKKTKDDIEATTLALREKNYTVIEYQNTKINSDLIRIQSLRGIMETHNKFNSRGKEILAIVSGIPGALDDIED
jgi:D-alanine-D-alanine ligase-like ATP-grasp enzyme